MTVVASLRGLERGFASGVKALGPIDLDVASGERVVITGANGSGKSTLLAALLGELTPSAGDRVVGRQTVIGTIDQRPGAIRGELPSRPSAVGSSCHPEGSRKPHSRGLATHDSAPFAGIATAV